MRFRMLANAKCTLVNKTFLAAKFLKLSAASTDCNLCEDPCGRMRRLAANTRAAADTLSTIFTKRPLLENCLKVKSGLHLVHFIPCVFNNKIGSSSNGNLLS